MVLARVILFVLIFHQLQLVQPVATVNKAALERNLVRKQKRVAKNTAEKRFRESHQIVFDSYGRVIRWPREPTDISCRQKTTKTGGFICTVTKWEERKYRSDEEENLQKMLRLDKQAELDRQSGSVSQKDKAQRRQKTENRKQCGMYDEWLQKFESSEKQDPKRRPFFKWLERDYADFGALRKLPKRKSSLRKGRKLYRHIALQIHSDKLPASCRGEKITGMMVAILENAEKIKDCMANPHTCVPGEL